MVSRWSLRVAKLTGQLEQLRKEREEVKQLSAPLETEIVKVRKRLRPFWDKLNALRDREKVLMHELDFAKAEAALQKVKRKTQLWIIHDPNFVGQSCYRTLSDEQAKDINSKREKGQSKPRRITVTKRYPKTKLGDTAFSAKDKAGREYFGLAKDNRILDVTKEILWTLRK